MPALRAATSADIPAIVDLIDAAYRHYIPELGGRRPRPMDDDQALRVANGELFVLEETGTLLGVITMQRQPDAIHIFNLAIHPQAQGRGLLHRLIGFAEATARDEHRSRLTLYTNVVMTRNRAIYAHLGFVEIGEHEAPGGYRIVLMERPVTPT
jgi:N-acetylglutamate synthase-like GNAT family acetyltransferase